MTKRINARGDSTLYDYDGNGNLVHIQYPIASMQAVENESLMPIAQQVQKKMFDVVENL